MYIYVYTHIYETLLSDKDKGTNGMCFFKMVPQSYINIYTPNI